MGGRAHGKGDTLMTSKLKAFDGSGKLNGGTVWDFDGVEKHIYERVRRNAIRTVGFFMLQNLSLRPR